jgi:hypothetical protein
MRNSGKISKFATEIFLRPFFIDFSQETEGHLFYFLFISGHQTVCRGTLVCREKFEMCRKIILRKSNFEVFPKICLIFSYKSCLILFVNQISH